MKPEPQTTESKPAAETRRPYQKPVLRRLGSVRDITLGSGKVKTDGFQTVKG